MGIIGTAGGGPDIDCVFMKFLMLFILACVNLVNIGMLDFFFRAWSRTGVSAGGKLLVEGGSMLITLLLEGVVMSSGLASAARKPLVLRMAVGLDCGLDTGVCSCWDGSLDAGLDKGRGGLIIMVLMFLTENF